MALRCGQCGSERVVNDLSIVHVLSMPQTHRCLECGYTGLFFVEERK